MQVAGVDGCPAGWLCIRRDLVSGEISSEIYADASALIRATQDVAVLTIDIPIGIPDTGQRECEVIARQMLGPGRASSVFPTPVRAVLPAATWSEACALSRDACGKAISQQTFAILDRIRDLDEILRDQPDLRARVREVHPEVCFCVWAGHPMRHAKRSGEGSSERGELVRGEFGPAFDAVRRSHRRGAATDDDIRDAFAALWTAGRIVAGDALVIPSVPQHDRFGLPMEMVA